MALLLALLFLVVPIAELAVIVAVAGNIGVVNTIGLLILVSVVGAWLAKREGVGVLVRTRAALERGELPSREVADGFLILLAGALMITPGFLSDCLALVLLFPPTRAVVRRTVLAAVARRGAVTVVTSGRGAGSRSFGPRGDVRRPGAGPGAGGVWDVESWEDEPPTRRDELGGPR
ncbi:MAG TPA: FxsA family protein [Acidimicrobiales bacterium]